MKKLTRSKRKVKRMSDQVTEAKAMAAGEKLSEIETIKSKRDGSGIINIDRSLDGQTIEIYIKNPLLADIVRKMANGNWPSDEVAKIYGPILCHIPGHNERIITKPAVSKISKNFVPSVDFSWDAPRAILLYNPDLLEAGFTLTYKVEAPFAPDVARKWGKMFRDGCNDIIANARPFQMTWVMKERVPKSPDTRTAWEAPAEAESADEAPAPGNPEPPVLGTPDGALF